MSRPNRCLIVIPCYNESDRLQLSRIQSFLGQSPSVSLLLVDDGSSDDTLQLLTRLQDSCSRQISLLALPTNQGKAEAVRRGMLAANEMNAEYVGFWDADLATPLEAVTQFVDALDRCPEPQIAWGTRLGLMGRTIQRHPMRRLLGRVFSKSSAIAVGLPIHDALCGAKLFRSGELVAALFGQPFQSRWIFDVELLARLRTVARNRTDKPAHELLYEVPLDRWYEIEGSRLTLRDFVRAGLQVGMLGLRCRLGRIHVTAAVSEDSPTLALPEASRPTSVTTRSKAA